MNRPSRRAGGTIRRFGVGEWYGHLFTELTPQQRREYAGLQAIPKSARSEIRCPFQSRGDRVVPCTKEGGVCSLRLYTQDVESAAVAVAREGQGSLRTTCPKRFEEDGTIYRWVGEELLGSANPVILGEIGFLSRPPNEDIVDAGADVGRIDNVLVATGRPSLDWCALEIQAVYFQGASMSRDYPAIQDHQGEGLAFPIGNRRLDYRSSGPKRLMPQLEIKVPSLRRWGKKMAVVIDEDFYAALGQMDTVPHVSNCDIAWFVVRYEEEGGRARLVPGFVQLTTLERAVEGLTAGIPISLAEFERRIQSKLQGLPSEPA